MQTQVSKCMGVAIIAAILMMATYFYFEIPGQTRERVLDPIHALVPPSFLAPSKVAAAPAVAPVQTALGVTGAAAAASSSSPPFVHQSWKTKDLPLRFIRWFATWETCFPGYQHKLWTDADNLELVRQKLPGFLDQYIRFKDSIQRADSARYLYMYHYGGIYSDLDNECLRSFQHLIDSSGCGVILGSMRSNRHSQYVQNSFMYSRPGHPFWLRVIEAMEERKDAAGKHHQETVDLTTGPQLLMHAIGQHKKTYEGTTNPGPICVFPDTYFNPYSWDLDKHGPCKDLNQMTETDLAQCKIKHKQAYVIQYHTQSWFAGKV